MNNEHNLDEFDHKIINILAVDGRISMTALGQQVGLSKTPVTARVKRLEMLGIILGYRAELSSAKLGMACRLCRGQALRYQRGGTGRIQQSHPRHQGGGIMPYDRGRL